MAILYARNIILIFLFFPIILYKNILAFDGNLFLKCLAIILLRLFISSKNPFNILTFMASEAVIYDSMI